MNIDPDAQYNHILFCTDFSKNADFAFQYALNSAVRSLDSDLYVLHVLPEPDAQFWRTYLYEVENVDEKANADMNEKIQNTYLKNMPPNINVTISIQKGKAEQEILKYAEKINADLIVMGRQGSSSLGTHLFGRVTEKIARKANCPVLIIPYSFEKKVESV